MKAEDYEVAISEATSSAVTWLALVDDGKHDASWDAASVLLRNSVTKEQFVQEMAAARQPLGKVISRVLKMAHTMTSLPGAPYGE